MLFTIKDSKPQNKYGNPYMALRTSFFQQIKADIPKLSQLTNTLIIHVF